jgi:hypothetical protein
MAKRGKGNVMKKDEGSFRKGMNSSHGENSTRAVALIPVDLGPAPYDAPMPVERNSTDTRSLEDRRPTTTRLRETIAMMKRGRV